MIRFFLILVFLFNLFLHAISQDLLKSRHTSYQTYIYQITDKEARIINSSRKWEVTEDFFHTPVASYPTDSVFKGDLLVGHYLKVFIHENELKIEYTSVQDLDVEVLNNSRDLNVRVFDATGKIISDARVKVGLKRLRFDSKTKTYRNRKGNNKGLLKVTYEDFTTYYQLSRNYNNSWARRTFRKTVYGTPLKYIWRPVVFVTKIPVDGVKSVIWRHPTGTIYRVVDSSKRLFYNTLCLFDDYYCNWYGNNWKFNRKYTGYMTFSKPKYQPGDTLRFKAFIIKRRNGKPLDKQVNIELFNYSKSISIATLKPYRPGGYTYEFVLSDTLDLRLDKQYSVELNNDKDDTYIDAFFRYEDYELTKSTLNLEANLQKHYRGDTAIVKVTAKDENDLNLLDGRIQVLVRPNGVEEILAHELFVPDTLFYTELELDPHEPTPVKLSDTLFPKANLNYSVDVTLLTSDNEKKSSSLQLKYIEMETEINYKLEGDSIQLNYLVNGMSSSKKTLIYGFDSFDNKVDSVSTTLPSTIPINSYFHHYQVISNDSVLLEIEISKEDPGLTFNAYRTQDSIFVSSLNPRKIPFIYYLYKTNHEVMRGTSKKLNLQNKASARKNYYLSVQYLWGGEVIESNYEIPVDLHALNIELENPPVVYPEQTVNMKVKITDNRGRPVSGVDILAHGMTKKLDANPVDLPSFEGEEKQRELINTFDLKSTPFYQSSRTYDYEKWNPLMVLDSITYFQFLYPEDGFFEYQYTPGDSITQFAPFVVRGGVIQPVNVVYVDQKPVYFSWSTNEPYSFAVGEGFHKVGIRTDMYEYRLDSIFIPEGKKLIFSIDHDNLPENTEIFDRGRKFTQREQSNLPRYVMPYLNSFGDRYGHIRQGKRLFSIRPGIREQLAGPIYQNLFEVNVYGDLNESLWYEPFFEYEFDGRLVKMRSKKSEILLPRYTSSKVIESFDDEPYTMEKLKVSWREELNRRRINSRKFINPNVTEDGEGKLILTVHQDAFNQYVLNSLLFKLDDPHFLQIYPGVNKVYHGLKKGIYRLIFLHKHDSYAMLDSIDIHVNGENHLLLEEKLLTINRDSFSVEMNQIMDTYFERNASKSLNKYEKEKLFKTYQKEFQYFGEGKVVSGHVYDETGEPLPGVSVLVDGTTFGTITDLEGLYSIKVPYDHSILTFSFVGYAPKEVDTDIESGTVTLEPDVQNLEEVVVVGYGVTEKKALTASVTQVTALHGKVAGVAIVSDGSIKIRGNSTVNSEHQPLLVIDGIPYMGDISKLDQSTFKSAEVVRSEEMVGLYGSKAANGVLFISTNGKNSVLSKLKGEEVPSGFIEDAGVASSIRKNFSDVAFWRPTLQTNEKGEALFEVTFPGDITSWDVFVYAVNTHKQSGKAQKSIKSFKPLSAQVNMPRFIIRGDSSQAIGKALNYTYDTAQITTTFELNDEITRKRDIILTDSYIDTLLLTGNDQDSLKIKYLLEKDDGYFDGELRYLPVYPVGVSKTSGEYAAFKGDTTTNWYFPDSLGDVKIYANARSLELLRNKINYLINYPYGCNEQLASKLKALLISLNLDDELEIKEARDRQIKRIVKKLTNNQNSKGLWGWWNKSSTSPWISVHVIEALRMANEAGYPSNIDREVIADEAVWNLTSKKPVSNRVDWLYMARLLDLSLNYGSFVQMLDTVEHTLSSKLRLAQIKQMDTISNDLKWLIDSLTTKSKGNLYLSDPGNRRLQSFYCDRKVDLTATALTLVRSDTTFRKDVRIDLEDYLLDRLGETSYYNTYTLSNVISALAPSLTNTDQSLRKVLSLEGIIEKSVTEFPFEAEVSPGNLSITHKGIIPTYINAYQTYWEKRPIKDSSSFAVVSRLENGGGDLKAGKVEKLLVEVSVNNDAEYVMIEIPIPAGCSYASKSNNHYQEVHREYFREKVVVFSRKLSRGKYIFDVDLLPRYSGSYTLNPAKAELMYFPSFYGHEGVKRVTIK